MSDTGFNAQFEALCRKANDAHEKIQSAGRCQKTVEVVATHGRAPDVAGQVGADPCHGADPAPWQEFRDRWRSHADKVSSQIQKSKADLDASEAMQNAGTAESYAREAIQRAMDAIDEAESAALEAMSARAAANALVP